MRFTYLALLIPALAGCVLDDEAEELSEVESEIIDVCLGTPPSSVNIINMGPGNGILAYTSGDYNNTSTCDGAVFAHTVNALVPKQYTTVRSSPIGGYTASECISATSFERLYYKSVGSSAWKWGGNTTRHGVWNLVTSSCSWVRDEGQSEATIPATYLNLYRIVGGAFINGAPVESVGFRVGPGGPY